MSCPFIAGLPVVTAVCTDILPVPENCHIYIINEQTQIIVCTFDGPKPLVGVCPVTPGKQYECYARWMDKEAPPSTTKVLTCLN